MDRMALRATTRWCARGGGCYDFVYSSVGLGERAQFQRHTFFFEGQNAHSFEIIPWSSSCPSPTSTGQKKFLKKNFGPFFQQKILICQTQKEKNRPDEKKTGGTKKYIPPSPPVTFLNEKISTLKSLTPEEALLEQPTRE